MIDFSNVQLGLRNIKIQEKVKTQLDYLRMMLLKE